MCTCTCTCIVIGNHYLLYSDGLSINVSKKRQFFDERWTKGKIVSSIAWSPHVCVYLYLYMYMYNMNSSSPIAQWYGISILLSS